MQITNDEKKLLKILVKQEIKSFETEGKTIIVEDFPDFLAIEEKYDTFLEKLLKKLE